MPPVSTTMGNNARPMSPTSVWTKLYATVGRGVTRCSCASSCASTSNSGRTQSGTAACADDVPLRRESARRFKWTHQHTGVSTSSNLKRIETEAGLDDADQERIEAARALLQDVSLLTQPQHSGDTDTQISGDGRLSRTAAVADTRRCGRKISPNRHDDGMRASGTLHKYPDVKKSLRTRIVVQLFLLQYRIGLFDINFGSSSLKCDLLRHRLSGRRAVRTRNPPGC